MPYDVSPITDHLSLGGALHGLDHAAWLADRGVTHIISVAVEHSDRMACDRHRLGYRHVRWYDDRQFKPVADFIRTLDWVRGQRAALAEQGESLALYVHCAMGLNRGPLMATFLLAALEGISADEAWSFVKRCRPQVEAFDQPAYRHSCRLALAGYSVNAVPETVAPHMAVARAG
jgi:hypothetical protein